MKQQHQKSGQRILFLLLVLLGTTGYTSLSFFEASRPSLFLPAGIERSIAMLRSVCREPSRTPIFEIAAATRQASEQFQLAEELLLAMMAMESGCITGARSPKGAVGLMQIMPRTAKEMGVADPAVLRSNIFGGAKYLSILLRSFNGNVRHAVAAYNAGPAAVRRQQQGNLPPYRETRKYVKGVLARYDALKKLNTLAGPPLDV